MYLTISDLQNGIQPEILSVVTRSSDNAARAISDAIDMAKSYLATRYDTDAEFARSADDRAPVVVKLVRDIAIYYCLQYHGMVEINEPRRTAYDDAIRYLEAARSEKVVVPGLIRLTGSRPSQSSYVRHGGNKKRNNQF